MASLRSATRAPGPADEGVSPTPSPLTPPGFLRRQFMLTRVTHAQSQVLKKDTGVSCEAASMAVLQGLMLSNNLERRIREEGWRLRMGHVLEGHRVQLFVLLLIVVDVICVCCEIMLGSVAGCRVEAEGGALPDGVKAVPLDRVEHWEAGLHWTSIAIVIALLTQQALLFLSYGLVHFTKLFNCLDLVILVVALGLELGLHGDDAPGIIVVVLGWRVVRVVHGFLATAETTEHERHILLHALAKEQRQHRVDVSVEGAFTRLQTFRLSARRIQRWYCRRKGWPIGTARAAMRASGRLSPCYDPAIPATFRQRLPSAVTAIPPGVKEGASDHSVRIRVSGQAQPALPKAIPAPSPVEDATRPLLPPVPAADIHGAQAVGGTGAGADPATASAAAAPRDVASVSSTSSAAADHVSIGMAPTLSSDLGQPSTDFVTMPSP